MACDLAAIRARLAAIERGCNCGFGVRCESCRAFDGLSSDVAALLEECERLNRMLRETGYGQGQIDAYVAQCEETDRLRSWNERLHAENERLLQTLEAWHSRGGER